MFNNHIKDLMVVTTFTAIIMVSLLNNLALANEGHIKHQRYTAVDVGPRPAYLVDKMQPGKLKRKLRQCKGPFRKSEFSIGHRGVALMFPEHTRESYLAAARMGAGIVECDVTYTADGHLVCRHAQCDLHTTTNILDTPLAASCVEPFTPAEFDADGNRTKAASAKCCAGALTVEEFKSLCGKMDARNPDATSVAEYLGGTANWRTDLYSTCGTLMTHRESIRLFKRLGLGMTPELKSPDSDGGFPFASQEEYAAKMIKEYKQARIAPKRVWAQSFNLNDVLQWIEQFPRFGKQAVYLDGRYDAILEDALQRSDDPGNLNPRDPGLFGEGPSLQEIADKGVKIIAPPMWVLLTINKNGEIAPSKYAKAAKRAGLDIITWTIERSGRIVEEVIAAGPAGSFYYLSTFNALSNDGDILRTLDVLARDVGVLGVFSDFPATTTYYANCMLENNGNGREQDD